MSKTKILIETFHTSDSSGGFFWCRTNSPDVRVLHREYERDVENGYAHVALIEIAVDSIEDEKAVTKYIDSELLDLLETRQIGKILRSHDRWGQHPYSRLVEPQVGAA